jgi:hypothetical protein
MRSSRFWPIARCILLGVLFSIIMGAISGALRPERLVVAIDTEKCEQLRKQDELQIFYCPEQRVLVAVADLSERSGRSVLQEEGQ